jgi:hypothetical protein
MMIHDGFMTRGRRFEPQSHPPRRIVEISNRPPNLSAKQSEVTIRTKNQLRKKLYFAQQLPKNYQKLPKIAQKFPRNFSKSAQKVPKTIR